MKSEFSKLIDPAKYQVFVFTCAANLPYPFASHTWVISNNKGLITRWEVGFLKNSCSESWNYLNKDKNSPYEGIDIIPFISRFRWPAKLIGGIDGGANSEAERLVNLIEDSPNKYPLRDKYKFLGPNSNTYTQWVISNSSELNIKLPLECHRQRI
jgi:hypothetical protein